MRPSTALLIALNAVSLFIAFLAFTSDDSEMLVLSAIVAFVTAATNGTTLLRRRDRDAPRPAQAPADELDATRVLDLDARLEALERAQADALDALDAASWRALAETGLATGPAAAVSGAIDERATRERA